MKRILYFVAALFLLVLPRGSKAQGWQQQLSGTPALWAISPVDSNVCWVAGDRMLVMRTTDGGNWKVIDNGLEPAQYTSLHARSASLAWVTSASKIFKTTNGGATWFKQYEYTGPGAQYTFFDALYFWDDQTGIAISDQVLANPNTMLVLRTTDGGASWNIVTSGLPSGNGLYGYPGRLDVVGSVCWFPVQSSTNTDTVSQRFLIRSKDKGQTWASVPIPAKFGYFGVSFSDTSRGILVGIGGRYALTTDGGINWDVRSGGVAQQAIQYAKGTGTSYSRGQNNNVGGMQMAKSTDYGITWTLQATGTRGGVTQLKVLGRDMVWAAGYGNTILKTRNGGVATSIARTDGQPGLPTSLELLQNYPNPFNPTTVIKFRLDESGPIRLVIYDELGREVRILMDGYQSAGWKQLVWDGKDHANRSVASGAYFYALRGANSLDAKRMILLK